MKVEIFILGGQIIDQDMKEGMVERLGEMRKGRRERIDKGSRERKKERKERKDKETKGVEKTI